MTGDGWFRFDVRQVVAIVTLLSLGAGGIVASARWLGVGGVLSPSSASQQLKLLAPIPAQIDTLKQHDAAMAGRIGHLEAKGDSAREERADLLYLMCQITPRVSPGTILPRSCAKAVR